MTHSIVPPLQALCFPYRELVPLDANDDDRLRAVGRRPGSALVWSLPQDWWQQRSAVGRRPGGMALIVLLPPAVELEKDARIWEMVATSRPQAILPHVADLELDELTSVMRKPPEDLPAAVTDYLRWRGIRLDGDTTHLVRRTLEMSVHITSVTALSRGLYLSRRALGRRFASRGLPVPSHWLQLGRILRFSLALQNSPQSIHSVAIRHSYPDGFAASNQVHRLVGHRPSDVRDHLGWEWIMEAWLRREAEEGAFSPRHDGEEVRKPVARPARATRRRRRSPTG